MLDPQRWDLDTWAEVVEKAGDAEAKANLQPSSYIREIDSRCPKGHRPLFKKDKKDTQRKHRDEAFKDRKKAKSHTPSTTNQLQTQDLKKRDRGRGARKPSGYQSQRHQGSDEAKEQDQGPEPRWVLHL